MNIRETESEGVFLTFEGDDGVGKSTQADLLSSALTRCGYEVVRVHEPGGTRLGERIRSLLLDREHENMSPLAELFLYEAARAQVMAEVIDPALAQGKVVICDRFTDSTVAYQGYGRELGASVVSGVNDLACTHRAPTRTLLLELPPELSSARVLDRSADGEGDRMESAGDAFHSRLRAGFSQIARLDPQRIHVINAEGSVEEVHEAICADVADLFPGASFLVGERV